MDYPVPLSDIIELELETKQTDEELFNSQQARDAEAFVVEGSVQTSAEADKQADRGVAYQEAAVIIPVETEKVKQAEFELDATYNARQCIIDRESRSAGMYTAEYGGSATGNDGSTASGAYQWLNSSYQFYLNAAESFYGYKLTSTEDDARGARTHAAYAEPFAQDLITAFALLHKDQAQNQKPWPYNECWYQVGSEKMPRPDGPEFGPTEYVLSQIG